MKWRFFSIIFLIGAGYFVLIFHLYDIQFNKGSFYTAKAQIQESADNIFQQSRGNIYFTDNNNLIPVVLNKDYPVVYAVPKELQQTTCSQNQQYCIAKIARELANILEIPVVDISNQLQKNNLYELLAQKISNSNADAIKKLNIKGIYIKTAPFRFYQFGRMAAHLLGFTSIATTVQIGRYGVEKQFNDQLAGNQDLFLTIDQNIQSQAEITLKNLMDKWSAASGMIIAEDPYTGKILAMASAPNFDPNNFSQSNVANFLNPAVQKIYEPGSVFKMITMASGIDTGKITPDTAYVDSGSVILNGKKIVNAGDKVYGKETMTNVIEHSINTGAVFAERKIGNKIFKNYVYQFGFGEPTGIELPGELKGNLRNLNSIYDVDWATASFGQGIAITPMELINAYSAIANGGILMKPLILADEKTVAKRRVISASAAEQLREMMESAVKVNIIADIPHYKVAGKTGTAYIAENGVYNKNDLNHTYIGFAPANHPLFVLLIKLEKPKAQLAGETIVPAFRDLAQYILNYYNAAPDN